MPSLFPYSLPTAYLYTSSIYPFAVTSSPTMQQTRSLISLFAFLAAILMATTCVDAAKLPVRQTNAERLRRNLAPLPPVKRTPTAVLGSLFLIAHHFNALYSYFLLPVAAARQAAASAGTTQGRAAITLADGTTLGHLSADDP